MRLNELPDDDLNELKALLGDSCDELWPQIQNLTLQEFVWFLDAKIEDSERKMERNRKMLAIERELNGLVLSVEEKHPGLPLGKAIWFLKGEVRARAEALLREREAMCQVIPVTLGIGSHGTPPSRAKSHSKRATQPPSKRSPKPFLRVIPISPGTA